jgi:hypothetical protein
MDEIFGTERYSARGYARSFSEGLPLELQEWCFASSGETCSSGVLL